MKKLFLLAVLPLALTISGCAGTINSTMKSISSEVGGGIPRRVDVYSYDGKQLRAYEGNIDIETTDSSHVQIMLNGHDRISINNAIVIAEDK